MKLNSLLVAGVIGLAIAGCRGNPPIPSSANTGGSAISPGDDSFNVVTNEIDDRAGSRFQSYPGMPAGDLELLENLVVYFEFDSSEIRSDFDGMLAAHGRYLAQFPDLMVRLEGHADERGSREYNIGLGDRRAQAVRQILLLQGASGSQLTEISYGEERPAVFGSDEEAYGLNRRVEIVYR